jgi:SAM-dependent methyltransferase
MTENLFDKYPEFISTDPRTERPDSLVGGYNVDADFQFRRHELTLPPEDIKNLSILDLGCCVGASGAWVLEHGAQKYVGVDLQSNFCKLARQNLSNSFPNNNWEIKELSFTDFFATNTEKFDVVLAFGVIYHSIYFETMIKNILNLNPSLVVIDSFKPDLLRYIKKMPKPALNEIKNYISQFPIIEYTVGQMVSDTPGYSVDVEQAYPSLPALQILMNRNGFELIDNIADTLGKIFPGKYQGRYCGIFKKLKQLPNSTVEFEILYNQPHTHLLKSYATPRLSNKHWVFDSKVANNFDSYVRDHIPDYDRVIDQCIKISKKLIKDPAENRIIDVGSAVGETIKRFYGAGFYNLAGVESSQDMLDKVKDLGIAHWIHSDQFPIDDGPYHAVLCNWTLHFIKNKISYLTNIYQGLAPGGFLIISDKTCNNGVELDMYHDFKRSRDVGEAEIAEKAASVKDIMFINEPSWYLEQLKSIGFDSVSIINAAPCFTTFLAVKKHSEECFSMTTTLPD